MRSRNNIYLITIFILILLISLTACSNEKAPQNVDEKKSQVVSDNEYLMSTMVEMKAYGDGAEKVIDKSFERMRKIDNNMSRTLKSSYISKINNQAGKSAVEVNESTLKVIEKALEYAELTNGKFDPTIGPLVSLWGIGTENARVPGEEEIKEAIKLVNYKWVEINKDKNKVKLLKEGMKLDLGAIAKGYAADEVRDIVKNSNVNSAFINIGGNVSVIGSKTDGSDWNVGVQDPRIQRGNVMGSIKLTDKTIVTSGNYERYFEKNNKIYHHILNPETGRPARNELLGVSIITRDSFEADAISTSVFILGLEEGKKLIEKMDDVEAIFITDDNKVSLTSGLKGKFKILNSDYKFIEGD